MNPKLNILVIGNGISGPVMAMALRKATPHNVILVDAGPEDAKAVGASVAITPNGMKALQFIGADRIVQARGSPLPYLEFGKGPSGSMLAHQEVEERFTSRYGTPAYGVQRQELCAGLRNLARSYDIDMRYDLRLTKVEEHDNIVTAHFANNQTLTADLLIGCDGIHSVTRSYVVGEDIQPRFAGSSIIIGLTKITEEELNAAGIKQGFHLWTGHGTVFGCFPCSPDGVWGWFNVFETKDPAAGEASWNKGDHSIEQLQKLVQSKIEGWRAPHPALLISKPLRAIPLGIYDRLPISTWNKGRVVLCGDAAHPTTPFGGQGAQMACESAVILARLLADQPPSDELFQRYVTLRRPRTDRVTINARRGIRNVVTWEFVRDTVIYLFGALLIRTGVMGHVHYDAGTAPLS